MNGLYFQIVLAGLVGNLFLRISYIYNFSRRKIVYNWSA